VYGICKIVELLAFSLSSGTKLFVECISIAQDATSLGLVTFMEIKASLFAKNRPELTNSAFSFPIFKTPNGPAENAKEKRKKSVM
jgi:hypothetical protein